MLKKIFYAASARAAVLAVTFALMTIATRVMLESAGVQIFGVVLTISALVYLLPFADLGLGAAIMTELGAKSAERDRRTEDMIERIGYALTIVCAALVAAAILLLATGAWGPIFGLPPGNRAFDLPATIVVILFALYVRLGVGYRVLVGFHKTHIALATQAATPVVTLSVVLVIRELDIPAEYYAIATPAGMVAAGALSFAVASRLSGMNLLKIRVKPSVSDPVRIRGYSIPMVAVSIATPIMLQSDRLILANAEVSSSALAAYALIFQLYGPLYNLATSTATPIWPHFARSRSRAEQLVRPWRIASLVAFAAGVALGVALMAGAPIYQAIVAGDEIGDLTPLSLSFGLLLVVQVGLLPTLSALNTSAGLRAQGLLMVLATFLKLPLAFLLLPSVGAPAPVFASCIALFVALAIPMSAIGARYLRTNPNK